ncbi:MAG: thioesterase family protein [Ardenticatenaceae bacterium]
MIPIEKIRQLPVDYRAMIPESYLDRMGHMNIQWYMALSNYAIPNFFDSFGAGIAYLKSGENGIFALKHHLQYLAEVRVGETVAMHTRVLGRSAKRLHFMQLMINESTGKLACTIEVLNSHIDMTIRRTSPYPPHIAAQIDQLLAKHQQLDWDAPVCGAIKP